MKWVESRREGEIAEFVRSLRDPNCPYKTADPRQGRGFPGPTFRLTADADDSLDDCLAEVWRRLLTDGRQHADHFPWGLRVVEDGFVWSRIEWAVLPGSDDPDAAEVRAGIAAAEVRLAHPGLVPPPYLDDESDDDHAREELRLALAVYEGVRRAVLRPDLWPLWQELVAGREVAVTGEVQDGRVDLGIGQPAMGPLPEYDRRLLTGHPDPEGGVSPLCRPLHPGAVPYNLLGTQPPDSEDEG